MANLTKKELLDFMTEMEYREPKPRATFMTMQQEEVFNKACKEWYEDIISQSVFNFQRHVKHLNNKKEYYEMIDEWLEKEMISVALHKQFKKIIDNPNKKLKIKKL